MDNYDHIIIMAVSVVSSLSDQHVTTTDLSVLGFERLVYRTGSHQDVGTTNRALKMLPQTTMVTSFAWQSVLSPLLDRHLALSPHFQIGNERLQLGTPEVRLVEQRHITVMAAPTGSPSRGGDITVYVYDLNQPSLPTPFKSVLVSVSVFYGSFNRISFHKFS